MIVGNANFALARNSIWNLTKKHLLISIVPCFLFFGAESLLGTISQYINIATHNAGYIGFNDRIPFIDDKIPHITAFAQIYIGIMTYGVFGPMLVLNFNGIKALYKFLLISFFVDIVIFLLGIIFPNYNVYTDFTVNSGFGHYDCWPSGHLSQTFLLVIGAFVKNDENKLTKRNIVFRIINLILFVLVYLSVLFTRQHNILDLPITVCVLLAVVFATNLYLKKHKNFIESFIVSNNILLGGDTLPPQATIKHTNSDVIVNQQCFVTTRKGMDRINNSRYYYGYKFLIYLANISLCFTINFFFFFQFLP